MQNFHRMETLAGLDVPKMKAFEAQTLKQLALATENSVLTSVELFLIISKDSNIFLPLVST